MGKSKLTLLLIIGLVILNLTTLGFIFFNSQNKRNHPPMEQMKGNPKEMIIEKLHFDDNQKKEFQKLIDWHKGAIQKHDKEIRNAKIELYSLLAEQNVDANAKDILTTVIATNQKAIEEAHFKHFEDIKKLCKANQLDDFTNLSKELARIFTPNKPQKGPREPREPREPRKPND